MSLDQTPAATSERTALERYLELVDERHRVLRRSKETDGRLRTAVKHAVPVGLRGSARVALTRAVAARERRRARALGATGLRLHLGSGGEHKDGWVNVDLLGDPVEVAWDLSRPLPFPDGSAAAVFHEHLLEHIPLAGGTALLAECFRVLRPGGLLRVGVPDAGRLLLSYAGDREYVAARHPGRPTALLAVQELFYWHRHTTMFDEETLTFLVRAAGFVDIRSCEPGASQLDPVPDTPRRAPQTLYVEAARP